MNAIRPRITARVDKNTQSLLAQAAALAGISSINSFVLSAAIETANEIIERERSLKLSRRDALMLIDALEAAPDPNAHLQQASQHYKNKVQ